MTIKENIKQILEELPIVVDLVAAVKNRKVEEILEAIEAGIKIIGENQIQEAKRHYEIIGKKVKWHSIGTLQKHNLKRWAIEIFDMIETVDSFEIACEINKKSAQIGKIMPVLIEINSGREPQKSGILPERAEKLIKEISLLSNIKVMGPMTIGPYFKNPEQIRPYFKETKNLFEKIKTVNIPNVEMKYLSMGMSDSYKIALEEGANIIRIGTRIFGERI